MLKRVGLEDRVNHLPTELSGGEQQRVAMGRALVVSPALILADEPTGNLDSKSADAILELMRQITQSGQTILMATHEQIAAEYTTRRVRLVDGEIVGDDPVGGHP